MESVETITSAVQLDSSKEKVENICLALKAQSRNVLLLFSGWKAGGRQGWEGKELPDVGRLLHEGDEGGQQPGTATEQHPVEVT